MNRVHLMSIITMLLACSLVFGAAVGSAHTKSVEQTITATRVLIGNQTQTPCAFSSEDSTLYIDIDSGGNDLTGEVTFSYTIDEVTYNRTGELKPMTQKTYHYTINSSELIGKEVVSWKVYLGSISTSEKSFYVREDTSLFHLPEEPDGENGWYVTEPLFYLFPDEDPFANYTGMTFYRWNGTGDNEYTSPFGLEDIPNPPKESAGKLNLRYRSDFECGNEETKQKYFQIDLTPPKFRDLIPSPDSILRDDHATIQATLDEIYGSNSGINTSSVILKINDHEVKAKMSNTTNNDILVSYFTDIGNGAYNVSLYAKDYAGNENSTSWTFYLDSTLPLLRVNSPEERIYNNRRVNVDLEIDRTVDKIVYTDLNTTLKRQRRLCINCDSFNRTFFFRDKNHTLSFKAISNEDVISEKNISFFIDSRDPRISRTSPSRGFANGTFEVKFREKNPKNLTLFYKNAQGHKEVDLDRCTTYRGVINCIVHANLSDYEGEEITYWFELTDIAGNIDKSRERSLFVDTTPPEMEIEYEIKRGYIELKIDVEDENFEQITYLDSEDRTQREKRLCTRLTDGVCDGRISLRDGNHSLTIIAKDDAKNIKTDNKTLKDIFIDSRDPRISRTFPSRGFTNGTFEVHFREENTKEVVLSYGNDTEQGIQELDIEDDCEFVRRNICSIDVDLSDFENQEIKYHFEVKDLAGNSDISRERSLFVDTTPPLIEDSSYIEAVGRRRLEFFLNITEKNFDGAYYTSSDNPMQRPRRLCTRLRENICSTTRFFSAGEKEITVIVDDRAGNSASFNDVVEVT